MGLVPSSLAALWSQAAPQARVQGRTAHVQHEVDYSGQSAHQQHRGPEDDVVVAHLRERCIGVLRERRERGKEREEVRVRAV